MLASLLYSSPCALCIVDAQAADQPVVYVNETFTSTTGYAADEVVGRNCRFLQAPGGVSPQRSAASAGLRKCASSSHVRLIMCSSHCL